MNSGIKILYININYTLMWTAWNAIGYGTIWLLFWGESRNVVFFHMSTTKALHKKINKDFNLLMQNVETEDGRRQKSSTFLFHLQQAFHKQTFRGKMVFNTFIRTEVNMSDGKYSN